MSKSLQFKNLQINWFYGAQKKDQPFEDFSPSFNILYGPNGSGKTTASHALQTLLWPRDSVDNQNPDLTGDFQIGQDSWKVNLSAGNTTYLLNNSKTDASGGLPSACAHHRLHDGLELPKCGVTACTTNLHPQQHWQSYHAGDALCACPVAGHHGRRVVCSNLFDWPS